MACFTGADPELLVKGMGAKSKFKTNSVSSKYQIEREKKQTEPNWFLRLGLSCSAPLSTVVFLTHWLQRGRAGNPCMRGSRIFGQGGPLEF